MKLLYILTFANGKQYVGQTSDWYGRWATHGCEAVVRNAQQLVYRAWRKYGQPNFQHLAVVEDYMIGETEIKAIAAYGTLMPNGYNMTIGGEAGMTGLHHSIETRAKISASNTGRVFSNETRKKIGEANRGKVRSSEIRAQWSASHTGKQLSQEHKDKIGKAHKGRTFTQETIRKISESNKRTKARILNAN